MHSREDANSLATACLQVAKAVIDGSRPEFPPAGQLPGGGFEGWEAYVDLVRRCWAENPQDRPGFTQIIADLR